MYIRSGNRVNEVAMSQHAALLPQDTIEDLNTSIIELRLSYLTVCLDADVGSKDHRLKLQP